jgi:hypothetical protein
MRTRAGLHAVFEIQRVHAVNTDEKNVTASDVVTIRGWMHAGDHRKHQRHRETSSNLSK